MKTYPMSAADAAWFDNDGPANLAIVMGVVLDEKAARLRARAQDLQRVHVSFDRFRQRVVEAGFPLATPHWQDMPNFSIDQHLHHIALAAPHDEAALVELVNDLASMPLDHSIPLWQAYVVERRRRRQRADHPRAPLHGRRHGDDDRDAAAVRPRPRSQAAAAAARPRGEHRHGGRQGPVRPPRSTSSPKPRATPSRWPAARACWCANCCAPTTRRRR